MMVGGKKKGKPMVIYNKGRADDGISHSL